MAISRSTEVLVIGAGPVGLLTALRLAEQGVDVEIVDKHRRTGFHSYALALHPQTLSLLAEAGLTSELLDRGRRVNRMSFYDARKERVSVSLKEAGGEYPFALSLPQSTLEHALEKQLKKKNVEVRWNHKVQDVEPGAAEWKVDIARLDGVPCGYPIARTEWMIVKTFHTTASFVVGADGYHSFLREKLCIDYRRLSEADTYSVFEFESAPDPADEVRVVVEDGRTSVLWPTDDHRCRWSFQVDDPEKHEVTLEYLNGLIEARAPWFPEVEGKILWSSMVFFDRRLVERFGQERTWLIGDAAHLTSPVGVQSMNAGLTEAWELGGRLARVARGEEPTESLEEFDMRRRQEWGRLLGIDTGLKAAAGVDPWVGDHAWKLLSSIPATGEPLQRLLRDIGLEYCPASDVASR